MSADVEFGVDFNRQNISRTHAKRERERENGGGGGGGGGRWVGEKRLNPPEVNLNVQIPYALVWPKVEGHFSSFREHPADAELGVFHHFPWQHATEDQGWIQQELVLRAPSFKRGPGGCDLLTVISEFSALHNVDISKWTSALVHTCLERTFEVLHRVDTSKWMSKMVHESLKRTPEMLHYVERKCASEMLH